MSSDATSSPLSSNRPESAQPALSSGQDSPGAAPPSRHWTWSTFLDAPTRRQLLLLTALLAISFVLRLATFDPIADGGWARHWRTGLVGVGASAAVWWLVRIQTTSQSGLPLVAAAVVLLSGDTIHYLRVVHPITRTGVAQRFQATMGEEAAFKRQWLIQTSGDGSVVLEGGAIRLASQSGGTAYIQANLGKPADLATSWWLPLGLVDHERSERLNWRATINRASTYYIVAELRQLLIQAVPYGLHLTYPDTGGALRGYEVQHPVGMDGRPHDWEISRRPEEIALFIDGQKLWAAPPREALNLLKLGETKSDPEHGGSMRVESASYLNTIVR